MSAGTEKSSNNMCFTRVKCRISHSTREGLPKKWKSSEKPLHFRGLFECKNGTLNSTCSCLFFYVSRKLPRRHFAAFGRPKVATWGPKGRHAEAFWMTFSSFVRKMQTVFGPRRLDRIRVLALCFRPLGFLGASSCKVFSQDPPKGYLNWEL